MDVGKFDLSGLRDPAHGALQGVLARGDAPVMFGLGVPVGFEESDDGLLFMNIEIDVE